MGLGFHTFVKRHIASNKRKRQSYYIKDIGTHRWAYISYIADIFHTCIAGNSHQNRREALIIGQVFNNMGYNTYIQQYDNNDYHRLRHYNFDIIFGLEPNIEAVAKLNPDALNIYYATGAYWQHQNNQVRLRTDEFNFRHSTSIPYRRLADEHFSAEHADAIIQIGNQTIIETYPPELRTKIHLVRQSTTEVSPLQRPRKVHRNQFLFIASSGNLLRGVPYLLDYFILHPESQLHWVGTQEEDVLAAYTNRITSNIHLYGFMDTTSPEFLAITQLCNFLIYPSGSEGCPGSVLLGLKHGLIPILPRLLRLDGLNCGYILDGFTHDHIQHAVDWTNGLSDCEIRRQSYQCQNYANANFTLANFHNDFHKVLSHIINTHYQKEKAFPH